MTPRSATARAACCAAVLFTLVAAPARAADAAPTAATTTIHLEGDGGAGYKRPALANEACLVSALERQQAAAGFDGKVQFTVERDGHLSGFALLSPATPAMDQAVRAAFASCPWQQGLDPDGKPVVVRVTQPVKVTAGVGAGAPATSPGLPPPPVPFNGARLKLGTEQASGYTRPTLAYEGCLPAALRQRRSLAGLDNKVKFAVMRDGSLSHFTFLSPVAPEVEKAVAEAFASCTWKPALDPDGRPLAVWVIQPVKVAGLPKLDD
jgi:hypothetical protein